MTENLSAEILDQIAADLELEKISSCHFLAQKSAEVSSVQAEALYIDQPAPEKHVFYVWILETYKGFYFLVGSEIRFFGKGNSGNPFQDSDDFFDFRKDIKTDLGLEYAEPFDGDLELCLTSIKVDGRERSFFLYKA